MRLDEHGLVPPAPAPAPAPRRSKSESAILPSGDGLHQIKGGGGGEGRGGAEQGEEGGVFV